MKISVCIPVYKVEPYIEKCARSLFAQTCADIEFVFVDDCSPDGSVDVLKRVLADYPARRDQVKIVRHGKNSGLIRARKTGIAAATGDVIAHCDSDDWVDPGLYGKMLAAFADPEVDMVVAPMVRNDDEPIKGLCNEAFRVSGVGYLDMAPSLVGFNSVVNKAVRREIATSPELNVPDSIRIGEDMCRTCQTALLCRKVASVTDSFYHYRVNLESMSQKFDRRACIDDLERVYAILDSKIARSDGLLLRKLALRDILFFGLRFGVMPRREFDEWSARFRAVPCGWTPDTSRKRRLMLELAFASYPLARLAFACLGWWKFKGL